MDSPALTISEILKLARKSGLDISQRTLRLYVDMGLIPKPDVRNRDEGGRSGYYDPRVVQILALVPRLQEQGYSLRDIKSFLDTLDGIARQSGKDALEVQINGLEAIAVKTLGTGESRQAETAPTGRVTGQPAVWKLLSGPVIAEMLRRGMSPDAHKIGELTLLVTSSGGEQFDVPLFLDPGSLVYTYPTNHDDEELAALTSSFLYECEGIQTKRTARSIAEWLDKSYDMSRANFILARIDARKQEPLEQHSGKAGSSILGFVALGVEPERIRLGQVRLEGPYVLPQYRGQGLGRELLRRAEVRALDLGAKHIDAFVNSESGQAISFLRHLGFGPEYFIWEAHLPLPQVTPTGEDPLADKSRMRSRLEIRRISSKEEFEQALALGERVLSGIAGYYPTKADDLADFGVTFPMEHYFAAYLDGELVGTVWNSHPSPRVYAVVLPRYLNTWIELALWRHILRHLREMGMSTAKTEVVSQVSQTRKSLSMLGFSTDKMVVCYRKYLDVRKHLNGR